MKILRRVIIILFVMFALGTICSFPLKAQSYAADNSWRLAPNCFGPVIKSVLIYFGETVTLADLNKEAPVIEDRFAYATGGSPCLQIMGVMRVPLPKLKPREIEKVLKQFPWLSEKSAERIWYYRNAFDMSCETYHRAKVENWSLVNQADVLIVMTEAQFEGGGVSLGNILFVEQPAELAWEKRDTYTLKLWPKWYIADVTVHELGHFMGLAHEDPIGTDSLGAKCTLNGYQGNVMSSCRDRESTSMTKAHIFSDSARIVIRGNLALRLPKTDP